MPNHKVKISTNASWCTVEIRNEASWVEPENSPPYVKRVAAKEILIEQDSSNTVAIDLEVSVETDAAKLEVHTEHPPDGSSLSLSSDTDSHSASGNTDDFSLRLT